ncbi:ABC transporter ATP-binding protein [Lacticaseibacillus porcinae]|uniref:ABC transporter ATP-binding protein n=1 Tax=Lacticaseibacillus porcinae TaxID=1123687 RepID=UPI000F7775EF|nr:ATP-binding cassette domain-containing protein [Lacticaseibacillus porcinae]
MTNIFELNQINLTIDDKPLLQDINLTVPTGAYLTLTGPSGSGKSTLLRVLATLMTPTSGTIAFNGKPQADYLKTDYRKLVSYCFQQPSLFGDTVRDNLAFPFDIRKIDFDSAQAITALQSVDLPETMLDAKITSLSGGEKQRVALIRNLLFPPQVLLLDEVTTGLDPDTKAIVHQLIESHHHQGITVIAVTHDETEVAQASTLLRLVAGRLEETANAK